MASVSIRPGTRTDHSAIRSIVRSAGLYPFDLGWRGFIVAETRDQVVGVGQVKWHRDGSQELASLAVVRECRGQGIGGQIVRALLVDDRDVYLYCRAELGGYYERFGFRQVRGRALPKRMALRFWLGTLGAGLMTLLLRRSVRLIAMHRLLPPELYRLDGG